MRGWLKIDLQTLNAGGNLPAEKKVYCPPRGKAISFEECAACEHCTGCVVDSGSDAWALRCECASSPGEEPYPSG